MNFDQIPDEIMLQIFKNLDIIEICQMSRVCKRWQMISNDPFLWYEIDISPAVYYFWHLFSKSFNNVRIVHLNFPEYNLGNRIRSHAMYQKLKNYEIKQLNIQYVDFNLINIDNLPLTLDTLRMTRCEIPRRWFNSSTFSLNLTMLDLSYSPNICDVHFIDLAKSESLRSSLRSLKVTNCYRVNDDSIKVLIDEHFDSLQRLNLEGTKCTAYGLALLCNKQLSKTLGYLNMKRCPIENVNIDNVKRSFLKDFVFIFE